MKFEYIGRVERMDFWDKPRSDVNLFLNGLSGDVVVVLGLSADGPMALTNDLYKKSLNVVVNNPDTVCYFGGTDLNIFNVMTGKFKNSVFVFKKSALENLVIDGIYDFLHWLCYKKTVHIEGFAGGSLAYGVRSEKLIDYIDEIQMFFYHLVIPTKQCPVSVVKQMGIDYLLDKACFLVKSERRGIFRKESSNGFGISHWGYDCEFNYSRIHNNFISENNILNDYVILVNDDIEFRRGAAHHVIKNLLLPFKFDDKLAVVGARLYYPNGNLQHVGVKLDKRLVTVQPGRGYPKWPGSDNFDTSGCVTFALAALDVKKYRELGGMDESLPYDFNDIDYCLRCKEKGYRVLYNPQAEAVHHESLTRKKDGLCGVKEDAIYFRQKHGAGK